MKNKLTKEEIELIESWLNVVKSEFEGMSDFTEDERLLKKLKN